MKARISFLFAFALVAAFPVFGQAEQPVGPAAVSDPVIPWETPEVRSLPPVDPAAQAFEYEAHRRQDWGIIVPDFDMPPHDNPLVELQQNYLLSHGKAPTAFGTPTVFTGYTSGASPPDNNGDVGPNHYLQGDNGAGGGFVSIYTKTGTFLQNFLMESLGAAPCNSGLGDPVIQYDEMADRWLISEFNSPNYNSLCVYISKTPDPQGAWWAYALNPANSAGQDYPKYAVWPTGYFVGVNNGGWVFAMNRANMLTGAATTMQEFNIGTLPGFSFQLTMPATLEGPVPPASAPALFLRPRDTEIHGGTCTGCDLMEMWTLAIDWVTPANSALTSTAGVQMTDWDHTLCGTGATWNCMPQAGTAQKIDPIREPLHYPLQYRNFGTHETLVGAFAQDTDGTDHAGVHWFEVRRTPPGSGAWTRRQDGVIGGEANVHRSVASAAMDSSGNIAVGYTRTGTALFPSIYYSGRLATDALGVMSSYDNVIINGTTSKTNNERWGDYSGIGVDPSNDCTFYYTTEFGGSGQTRIAYFTFPTCGCAAVPAAPIAAASAAAPNRIDVTWNDSATASITQYYVYRSTTPGGPYTQIATVIDTSPGVGGGPSYTYQDTTVSGGTTYYYTIKSNDGGACTSNASNEASATATGACTLAPSFAGLTSVTNPGSATCTLNLAWSAGSSNCAGALTYSIYRSTVSGFIPAPANRIASGVSGTAYSDAVGIVSGTTYYYVVHAIDSGSGSEDANVVERNGAPSGPFTNGTWSDDAGDTGVAKLVLVAPWSVAVTGGRTAPRVYQTGTYTDSLCAALTTPTLLLGTSPVLSFASKYDIETGYDVGIVEIATSPTFTNWTKLSVTTYPNGLLNNGNACLIPTSGANTVFSLNIAAPTYPALYTSALAAYNGQQVKLRWNFGSDSSVTRAGWWIDDISITNVQLPSSCATGSALPKPVPDGNYVPGTPLKGTRNGATIDTTWDPAACGSSNYNLYRGFIGNFTAVAGGTCNIGTTGSATGITMPANSWWIIAGTSGSQVSSFGRVSGGAERVLTGFAAACPAQTAQNTTATCP